jgi:hypothetical protein
LGSSPGHSKFAHGYERYVPAAVAGLQSLKAAAMATEPAALAALGRAVAGRFAIGGL